jgi:hypothetical protein
VLLVVYRAAGLAPDTGKRDPSADTRPSAIVATPERE